MTQQCDLQISELKPLMEQLCLARECLEQLISLLSGLKIRVDLPEPDLAQLELNLVGQELVLRRKSNDAGSDFRRPLTLITGDARMRVAAGLARSMAETDAAVLIHGATGAGKNLFARLIHQQGNRSDRPLIWVPCGLLNHPDGMTRVMKFFHEAGNGTLVLEDIEDLGTTTQTDLSRVLQQPPTCRLISLTCSDPDELVERGEFSAVLLEQLRDCHIALPDLARRGTDIELLARHYCLRFCAAAGLAEKQLSPEYLDLLSLHAWPGNVRELINTLEQSLLCARDQKTLYAKDLPAHIRIQTLQLSSVRKKGL